jgi:hypothetical protein
MSKVLIFALSSLNCYGYDLGTGEDSRQNDCRVPTVPDPTRASHGDRRAMERSLLRSHGMEWSPRGRSFSAREQAVAAHLVTCGIAAGVDSGGAA